MVRAATIAGFPGVDVGCIRRSDVTNFVSATGTNQFTDATAPSFPRRFYRAVTP